MQKFNAPAFINGNFRIGGHSLLMGGFNIGHVQLFQSCSV